MVQFITCNSKNYANLIRHTTFNCAYFYKLRKTWTFPGSKYSAVETSFPLHNCMLLNASTCHETVWQKALFCRNKQLNGCVRETQRNIFSRILAAACSCNLCAPGNNEILSWNRISRGSIISANGGIPLLMP